MTHRERGQDVQHDSDSKPIREWLVANGAGGFAYGGSTGVPERRTHAWLHAADAQGAVITVLLGLEERTRTEEGLFHLSEWPGREAGEPVAVIESFHVDPWPTWRIRAGGLLVERALIVIHGHQAIAVTYRHLEGPHARLRLQSARGVARTTRRAARESRHRRARPGYSGSSARRHAHRRAHAHPVAPGELPAESAVEARHRASARIATLTRRRGGARSSRRGSAAERWIPRGDLDRGELVPHPGDRGSARAPPPSTLAACVAALLLGEQGRRGVTRSAAQRGADFTARQAAAAHGDAAARAPQRSAHRAERPLEHHARLGHRAGTRAAWRPAHRARSASRRDRGRRACARRAPGLDLDPRVRAGARRAAGA